MHTLELNGTDRVEFSPELRRPIRMGAPEALAISNADRIRELLRSREFIAAGGYLSYLHELDKAMLSAFIEWCFRWQEFLTHTMPTQMAAINVLAMELWFQKRPSGASDSAFVLGAVEKLIQNISQEEQSETEKGAAQTRELLTSLTGKYEAVVTALRELDAACAANFESYLNAARTCHDALTSYCWSIMSAVLKLAGQNQAEAGIKASFEACSFHAPTWEMFNSLKPELLVAVLAEHLRAHFSGPARDGAVTIVEDADRYRILMEPCGSGGAIRRAIAAGTHAPLGTFETASPATWGRTDVPAYCAHCALNEEYSRKHFGRALWVTEFNPDASKPCCWSVRK